MRRAVAPNVINQLARASRTPAQLRPFPRLPRTLQPACAQWRRYAHSIPKPRQAQPATPNPADHEVDPGEKLSQNLENRSRKFQEPHYELTFTCIPCGSRSTHAVSKQAYHKGSALITCPSCRNRHVISDHLNIFGNKDLTIEDIMRERGQLVKRGTLGEDGDVEFWEDGTTTQRGADSGSPATSPAEADEASLMRETKAPSSTHSTNPSPSAPLGTSAGRPSLGNPSHSGTTPSSRREYSKKPRRNDDELMAALDRSSKMFGTSVTICENPLIRKVVSPDRSSLEQETPKAPTQQDPKLDKKLAYSSASLAKGFKAAAARAEYVVSSPIVPDGSFRKVLSHDPIAESRKRRAEFKTRRRRLQKKAGHRTHTAPMRFHSPEILQARIIHQLRHEIKSNPEYKLSPHEMHALNRYGPARDRSSLSRIGYDTMIKWAKGFNRNGTLNPENNFHIFDKLPSKTENDWRSLDIRHRSMHLQNIAEEAQRTSTETASQQEKEDERYSLLVEQYEHREPPGIEFEIVHDAKAATPPLQNRDAVEVAHKEMLSASVQQERRLFAHGEKARKAIKGLKLTKKQKREQKIDDDERRRIEQRWWSQRNREVKIKMAEATRWRLQYNMETLQREIIDFEEHINNAERTAHARLAAESRFLEKQALAQRKFHELTREADAILARTTPEELKPPPRRPKVALGLRMSPSSASAAAAGDTMDRKGEPLRRLYFGSPEAKAEEEGEEEEEEESLTANPETSGGETSSSVLEEIDDMMKEMRELEREMQMKN